MESSGKKVTVAVVLFLVAGMVWVVSGSTCSNRPTVQSVDFVCLETGKTYTLSPFSINAIPCKNPDTGRRTLFPCYEDGGSVYVTEHYRSVVKEMDNLYKNVDHETYAVTIK